MGSLLERQSELGAIAASLRGARSRDPRPLLIEGPAGIGKTALLDAACAMARREGMVSLRARGADLERAFPFGVVRQLFERRVHRPLRGPASSVLAGAAGLSAPVFGLPRPDGLLPPADEREAVLIGLYWLMAGVAETRPLVAVVDDLQWADAASLEWLLYTLARLDGVRATVIAATRSDEAMGDNEADLVAALARNADLVTPAPLGEEAAGDLLEAVLGAEVDDAARGACFAMTIGNPLLIREVGRALAESGPTPSTLGAPDIERVSSPRISRLIQDRLRAISGPAMELARAIATLGPDAELAPAASLTGLPIAVAAKAADELRARGFLDANPRLGFVHPLVARAVYDDVPAGRRGMWHARAARLLDDGHAANERVAAHLLRTDPVGDEWAAGRLRAAGRDAMARGAPQSAGAVLGRALREGTRQGRAELLFELGCAESVVMNPAASGHLRAAYDVAGPGDMRTQIALVLARSLTANRLSESGEFLQRAIDEVAVADRDVGLRLEAIFASGLRMDPDWAATIAARLRAYVSDAPVGRTAGERALLACLAGDAAFLGEPREAFLPRATAALGGGRLLTEETSESPVFLFACSALSCAGRYAQARAHLSEALTDSRARGSAIGYAFALTFRAEAALAAGDVRDAEADGRAALDAIGEHRAIVVMPLVVGWLACALLEQGRPAEAASALVAATRGDATRPQAAYAPIKHARGMHALAVHDAARARSEFLDAGRDLLASLCPAPTLVPWRSAAARAAALLGDHGAARAEAEEELLLAEATGSPAAIGTALRAVAGAAEPSVRVDRLREAVGVVESSEARLEHAYALCDLGIALRHAGAARDAREPLRLATDIAAGCGAVSLAERARGELLASGARPRRTRVFGRDALTPAEMRVAELASGGLSNREIAQTLFVTVKTIETQLGAAYRKLGIGSRRELGGALAAEASDGREPLKRP